MQVVVVVVVDHPPVLGVQAVLAGGLLVAEQMTHQITQAKILAVDLEELGLCQGLQDPQVLVGLEL